MNRFLFLVIYFMFVANLAIAAKFSPEQKKEVDYKVFKAEQHLKKLLAEDIKMALGVNELLLQIKLKIDETKLYKDINGSDQNWEEVKNMQLPSLFIDANKQTQLKEIKTIEVENILSHITDMEIKLYSPYDIVNESSFKTKLKDIVSANFAYLESINLVIDLKKTQNYLKDTREFKLAAPELKIDLEKLKTIQPYFWGVVSMVIVLGGVFAYVLRTSLSKLKQAVENKELGSIKMEQSNFDIPNRNEQSNTETSQAHDTKKNIAGSEDFQYYYQEVDRIRKLVGKKYNLVKEMIKLSHSLQEHEQILVLFELLPESEKNKLFEEMSEIDVSSFKHFIFDEGELTLKKAENLYMLAKELNTVFSLTLINSSYLYNYFLKKVLNRLDDSELIETLQTIDVGEFYYLIANTDPAKIALLFSNDADRKLNWPENYYEITEDEIKLFIDKMIYIVSQKSNDEMLDPRLKTLPYLPEEVESTVLSSLNFDESFKFHKLVEAYSEFINDKIKGMSFEEIKHILPMFQEQRQAIIISNLPEIIAERLNLSKQEVNKKSFDLKAKLYTELMEIHQEHINIVHLRESSDSESSAA